MLTAVLDRDGQLLSATQDRHRALADADHLAVLHAIWTAETTPAREQRYKDMLSASLPPGYHRPLGHQARWLWRTLRTAELAGLDAAQVLAAAIAERDLAGSRDLAAVIEARLRHRLGTSVPFPVGPWSSQVPALTDTARRSYLAEIATLMDARKDRIGEHAADHAPSWAVTALGPVPGHPLDRLGWQRRASSIGAWRELSGYDHPADPIGPEPVAAVPDLRAARQQALASSYRAMHDAYRDREATFAAVMADRADWDAATRHQRHLAVAADTELRRRHPTRNYPPLRSAEPPPATQAQRDGLTLTAGEPVPEPAQWIKDLTAQRRAFADRLANHQSLMVPAADPDYGDLGQAFPPWPAPARQPILQPPRPEIQPSEQILERVADRETDWEAAN